MLEGLHAKCDIGPQLISSASGLRTQSLQKSARVCTSTRKQADTPIEISMCKHTARDQAEAKERSIRDHARSKGPKTGRKQEKKKQWKMAR